MIDLTLLRNNTEKEIDISNTYEIPKEYYENSDILEIKPVKVTGKVIEKESIDDYDEKLEYIEANIDTTVVIEDSISLEPINYKISLKYDDFVEENYKNSENSLDILTFLCENIVLEVPLHYTEVEDLKKFSGDGWRLVNEEDLTNTNNPFKDLLNKFDKE